MVIAFILAETDHLWSDVIWGPALSLKKNIRMRDFMMDEDESSLTRSKVTPSTAAARPKSAIFTIGWGSFVTRIFCAKSIHVSKRDIEQTSAINTHFKFQIAMNNAFGMDEL